MAFTQADLDAINAQIASAEESLRYGDRQVTYFGVDDLKKRRQLIVDDLAAQAGAKRKRVVRLSQGGNGYGC